jgi:anti-sigma B factor antagonist
MQAMDDRRFAAVVTEVPDEVRLRLSGDLNARADDTLAGAYAKVVELGPRRVSLDFGSVGYINSTGIALVVRLLADARRDGRTVRAVGLSEHYREIFRITRLSDFMEIVEGDAA